MMNKKFIEHNISFDNGDIVKHKSAEFKMVVIETEEGYQAPYSERIICSFWHPIEHKFVTDKFLPIELEGITH